MWNFECSKWENHAFVEIFFQCCFMSDTEILLTVSNFFFFFFLKTFPGKGLYFSMRVPHVGGIGFDPMSPPPTRGFSWGQPLTIFADHWTTNDLKVTRHNKSMTIIHFFLSEIIFCEKKLKLYGPFLWMVFNCLKASATSRRQFTFYP